MKRLKLDADLVVVVLSYVQLLLLMQSSPVSSAWMLLSTDHRDTPTITRRDLAQQTTAASTLVLLLTGSTHPAQAAAPVDAGEAVRRSAANLPGFFGPTDVFYPADWKGTWKVRRQILLPRATTAAAAAAGNNGSNDNNNPLLVLEYNVRFIPSIQDDSVVADRGFNQANLENALQQQQQQLMLSKEQLKDAVSPTTTTTTTTTRTKAVRSYQWTETNPNDVRLAMESGDGGGGISTKEIKVTKRATERTADTVFSSEFQRVTQQDDDGSGTTVGVVPVITARRVLTKWKAIRDEKNPSKTSMLEALEIVYDVGSGGDPIIMTTTSLPSGDKKNELKVLSKSRLFLERI